MSGLRHIVPERTVDPRCRGLCRGDRPANDGPARPAHRPDGTKVMWCPCCEAALRPEGPLDFTTGPPNVRPDIAGKSRRFFDDICQYETVLLKDIKAR